MFLVEGEAEAVDGGVDEGRELVGHAEDEEDGGVDADRDGRIAALDLSPAVSYELGVAFAAVAVLVFALLSPYTLLDFSAFW